ncbi:MAG: cytochrome C [Desulfuromonadales bacterium]|nr:cytochrome C [Desulfuromonadales bacterium]
MRNMICLVVVSLLVFSGVALAVPASKTLEFKKSPMGTVTFSGKIHKEAGIKCKECHNKDVFPKMKYGTVTITMNDIYASKLCGVCHNGGRAFDAKGNCNRCHVKK